MVRIRPQIRCVSPLTKEDIIQRIGAELESTGLAVYGKRFRHHVELHVKPEERHYWSPVLTLTFQEREEGGTLVRGRFGPESKIWTMFMFFYFFALALTFFSGIYGLVQLQLDYRPWSFWVMGLGLLLIGIIFLAAQMGQKKGHEQTQWLQSFCKKALGEDITPA